MGCSPSQLPLEPFMKKKTAFHGFVQPIPAVSAELTWVASENFGVGRNRTINTRIFKRLLTTSG
jgi:hypothetical protein